MSLSSIKQKVASWRQGGPGEPTPVPSPSSSRSTTSMVSPPSRSAWRKRLSVRKYEREELFKALAVRTVNAVAFGAAVLVLVLANTVPFNDRRISDVAPAYPSLFYPAPYAYFMWAAVMVGLGIGVGYSLVPGLGLMDDVITYRMSILPMVAYLLTMAWVFTWHWMSEWVSVVMIGLLLLVTIVMYAGSHIKIPSDLRLPRFIGIQGPVSLYLGWVSFTVVSVVAVAVSSVKPDLFGWAPEVWAVVLMGLIALITVVMLLAFGDVVFAVPVIWGLVGMAVEHTDHTAVVVGGWAGAGILVVLAGLSFLLHFAMRVV
eukprot:gb/GECH01005207.1/.p1 GENE.gb/GECH01005207.1/~~gb/GECH01005207.1/.p1  ORF type:complete len:316 (+),score=53.47 gb/GECH01005207.1/:1-948(+)